MNNYDVIIIGAGSIGVPCALFLAEKKLKVLVLESAASVGQGQNKAAIGGIRATHSDGSKIRTSLRSIEIFSRWKEENGDDINWQKGGYAFPAYTGADEKMMMDLLLVQKSFGLQIEWVGKAGMKKIVPGINEERLRGGTYAPNDGNASPLLSINAFYRKAVSSGAVFRFKEPVTGILCEEGSTKGVFTSKGRYYAPVVINAAGACARKIGLMAGIDLPVKPDSHEAGITEPVERILHPLLVDIRAEAGSKNVYFYQNKDGQIEFCLTPDPPAWGTNKHSTSSFLPVISKRMITLVPRLVNVKVRRTWRGLYPMTPDGFPIVERFENPDGFIAAAGMCGQGFMLGPGIGELVAKMATGEVSGEDREILKGFSSKRNFSGMEKFK